jgi:hypothetical protein
MRESSPQDQRGRRHSNRELRGGPQLPRRGAEDRAEGQEPLEVWQTSSGGPISDGRLYVEARRRGDEVLLLVHVNSAAASSRTFNALNRGPRKRPVNEEQIRF